MRKQYFLCVKTAIVDKRTAGPWFPRGPQFYLLKERVNAYARTFFEILATVLANVVSCAFRAAKNVAT